MLISYFSIRSCGLTTRMTKVIVAAVKTSQKTAFFGPTWQQECSTNISLNIKYRTIGQTRSLSPPPSPLHLRTETDTVFGALCFLLFRIRDDGQIPKPRQLWVSSSIVRTL
jgi:hypothetical protein